MQTAHMPQAAKWGRWKLLGIVPLMLLAGCQSSSGTGALVGGGAGALLGNGIAKAAGGSRTAGTAIGGILGAVGGAVVGDGMDQQRAKGRAEGAAAVAAQQNSARAPTIEDIIALSTQGTHEQVIINQIRSTGAVYRLTSSDLQNLQASMVPASVIAEMQMTANRPAGSVVYQPAPRYQRVVVVEEPPPAVGVGFSYTSGGRRR
jgi:hypothetical protein